MDQVVQGLHRLALRRSREIDPGRFGRKDRVKLVDLHGVSSDLASVPIPTFASLAARGHANVGIEKDTSNNMFQCGFGFDVPTRDSPQGW
jgi:hypothetical protein